MEKKLAPILASNSSISPMLHNEALFDFVVVKMKYLAFPMEES